MNTSKGDARDGRELFRTAAAKRALRAWLVAIIVAACGVGACAQGGAFSGRWNMETLPEAGKLQAKLSLSTRPGSRDDRFFKLSLAELSGLTREQIDSAGARVKFQLRRAAGTFDFEGTFGGGRGEGTFTFSPDAAFVAEMEREGYGEAVRQNLFGFAVGNFSTLVAELASLNLGRPTPRQLDDMNTYGVNAEYIRELTALGYRPTSIKQLIDLRLFGASADFVKAVAAAGYERPTLDQLIEMRVQGVTPAFIAELKSLGYERVPLDELISMRMQGVTPDFIRGLKAQGYEHVPLERLFDVRMLGMPAELLRHLPPDEPGDARPRWLVKFYRPGTPRVWMHWRDRPGTGGRSFEVAPAQLVGLDESQAFSEGAQVSFRFTHDGEELSCAGWFKGGFGAGSCDAPRTAKGRAH